MGALLPAVLLRPPSWVMAMAGSPLHTLQDKQQSAHPTPTE